MINCPHMTGDEKCDACKTLEELRIALSESHAKMVEIHHKFSDVRADVFRALRRIERLQKGK